MCGQCADGAANAAAGSAAADVDAAAVRALFPDGTWNAGDAADEFHGSNAVAEVDPPNATPLGRFGSKSGLKRIESR